MKRKTNLYDNMLDYSLILKITKQVLKNTKNKSKIYKYESIKLVLVSTIYNILKEGTYVPSRLNKFVIYEPKKRIIYSQEIIDRIINHLVSRCILIPSIEPVLIDSNVACRIGKGTSYGRGLYYKYLNICNRKYNEFYILKLDIKKYFESIDKEILKKLIRKRIKEEKSLNIIDTIIDNHDTITIGSMSSQIFAIYYLNDIDHCIKEVLKIKYYIRYQDDMILIHKDREYLKYCLSKIEEEVNKLGLELNKKTRIYKNNQRINFIGVRKNKRYSNIVRTRKKYKYKLKLYMDKNLELNSLVSTKLSYLKRKKGFK